MVIVMIMIMIMMWVRITGIQQSPISLILLQGKTGGDYNVGGCDYGYGNGP